MSNQQESTLLNPPKTTSTDEFDLIMRPVFSHSRCAVGTCPLLVVCSVSDNCVD